MFTFLTSDFYPSLELSIQHYRENLAVLLESICLVLHTLEEFQTSWGSEQRSKCI